ncbi:AraC family transcriptional regulator [Actinacidiphila acididurans]|uniref:AraC family transcriptional regulator n=1 Tax=Actinacidiphila acididurans TaxID=2784346 RepID=UPI0027DE5DF5|nr:AraC family transcriptional regulator [Actinacidiphila acididurans]
MDLLSDQLARARAKGAVFSTLRRVAPWGLGFSGQRPLTAHILLDGEGWVVDDAHPPLALRAGDVLLATAGAPYRVTSHPDADAVPIADARHQGSDDRPGPAARILCGAYVVDGSVGTMLLGSLPRYVHVPADRQDSQHRAAIALLGAEAGKDGREGRHDTDGVGRQALLDRLLDLNLVYALRTWWQQDRQHAPGWYRALAHPGLKRVIEAVHQDPGGEWSLERMAGTAAMSRAAFAAAFKEVVGEPPARYLRALRMALAEDALLRTDATLGAIAADVGYRNEFAFATAFRRDHGVAPGRWRSAYARTSAMLPGAGDEDGL